MPQQLILEIQNNYPFGENQMENPQQKIFTRKRIEYNNQESYNKILEKINIIKKLKHSIIIPLVRLLQQEGSFHLIYQYVPLKFDKYLQKISNDQIQVLKKKLIMLSTFFFQNRIDVNFESKNVGFSKSFQLKFYLGIDFIMLERSQQAIKNKNILQINKIFQNIKMYTDKNLMQITKMHFSQKRQNLLLAEETKSNRIKFKNNQQQLKSNRLYSPPYVQPFRSEEKDESRFSNYQSKYRQKSIWTTKSRQGLKPLEYHTQLLNSLQQKIQEIKKNLQKCNPKKLENIVKKTNQVIQSKNQKAFGVKQKNYDRKLSFEASYVSSFGKNSLINTDTTHSSVKNYKTNIPVILENIKQNSEQSQNNLGTGNTPKERKQSAKLKEQSIRQRKQSLKSIVQRKDSFQSTTKKNQGLIKKQNAFSPSIIQSVQQPKLKNSMMKRQSILSKKEPLTKHDFQQIKKNEFQNFFASKQKYVHQFLGILDDVRQQDPVKIKSIKKLNPSPITPVSNPIQQNLSPKYNMQKSNKILMSKPNKIIISKESSSKEKNKITKESSLYNNKDSNPSTPKRSSQYGSTQLLNQNQKIKMTKIHKSNPSFQEILYNDTPTHKIQKNNQNYQQSPASLYNQTKSSQSSGQNSLQTIGTGSSQNIPKQKQLKRTEKSQLKNRISKVLQKCDLAFLNYRKLSTNNIPTQFSKK